MEQSSGNVASDFQRRTRPKCRALALGLFNRCHDSHKVAFVVHIHLIQVAGIQFLHQGRLVARHLFAAGVSSLLRLRRAVQMYTLMSLRSRSTAVLTTIYFI